MSRRRLCAGNWKMYKTAEEACAFARAFVPLVSPSLPAEVVLCPPFTALCPLVAELRGTTIALGAQDVYWEPEGAYTGAISARMLADCGAHYVIVGHSERRQLFGESDDDVRKKTIAALDAGLTPIVAVGEGWEIRERGDAEAHVRAQVRASLQGISSDRLRSIAIAYEPIWAIGSGRNCGASLANDAIGCIRESVAGLEETPILYGGSVKAENIAAYMREPEIDGALVGGASLDPHAFARICDAVAQ